MTATSPNHTRCVGCGDPHDHWPAPAGQDGELCSRCFDADPSGAWPNDPADPITDRAAP